MYRVSTLSKALKRLFWTQISNTWRICRSFGTDYPKYQRQMKNSGNRTYTFTGNPRKTRTGTPTKLSARANSCWVTKATVTRHKTTSNINYQNYTVQRVRMRTVQFIVLNILQCNFSWIPSILLKKSFNVIFGRRVIDHVTPRYFI